MTMIYVLTQKKSETLKTRLNVESLVCYRCGREFQEGDKIMSRPTSWRRRRYHVECWKSMFV